MKSKGNVFINAEDLYQGKTAKIVYNGNFYDIKFANLNNDSKCLKMFNKFTSSLSFE